jgi:hypothetical protein
MLDDVVAGDARQFGDVLSSVQVRRFTRAACVP